MSYRTYSIRHSLKPGTGKGVFEVSFVERSKFKSFIGDVASGFCRITGHHFCNSRIISPLLWWADKDQKVLNVMPITREVADQISGPDSWSWLDDEPTAE